MLNLVLLLTMFVFTPCQAIIGYDCRHPKIETTVIDGKTIKSCVTSKETTNVTQIHVQLLQRDPLLETPVFQCYVRVTLIISRCGMWSHVVHARDPHQEFIDAMSGEDCKNMIMNKQYRYRGTVVNDRISLGTLQRFSRFLVGSIDQDGNCEGGYFALGDNEYHKAIVQASFEVLAMIHEGLVDLVDNVIHVKELNAKCKFSDGSCLHQNAGILSWTDKISNVDCERKQYEVLYSGLANMTTGNSGNKIISLTSDGTIFSLLLTKEMRVCSVMGWATEHPRLFFAMSPDRTNVFKLHTKTALNRNLIAYINTKIVYVERHIESNMNDMYKFVMSQKCELERMTLSNLLSLAYLSEDEFAYTYKRTPGYTAVVRGEVIHLIKCVPVDVKLHRTSQCYNEAVIEYQNNTKYLSPRNHVIKDVGTELECNHLVPVLYHLTADEWFSLYPTPRVAKQPVTLDPNPNAEWKYTSLHGLAVAGVYSLEEVEALQNQLMFAGEQKAIDNSLARKYAGEKIDIGMGNAINLFSTGQVKEYFDSTWAKVKKIFTGIGDITSMFIGIFVIFKGVIMLINCVLNYLMLKDVFGAFNKISFLFCCNSLVHYLLLRYKSNETSDTRVCSSYTMTEEKDIELTHHASKYTDETKRLYPSVSHFADASSPPVCYEVNSVVGNNPPIVPANYK